mgnify:CR=1 FL=1
MSEWFNARICLFARSLPPLFQAEHGSVRVAFDRKVHFLDHLIVLVRVERDSVCHLFEGLAGLVEE